MNTHHFAHTRMAKTKRQTITSVNKVVDRWKPSYIDDGNVK